MNKRLFMILTIIGVTIMTALLSLAQKPNRPTKTQSAVRQAQVENVLTVNGVKISGRILDTNNVKYIAIDDLANGLNGSVTYIGNQILVDLPILQKVSRGQTVVNPPSILPGKVKGLLTYNNFNSDDGKKPDVGAKIYLVEGFIDDLPAEASASTTNTILSIGSSTSGWKKEYKLIFQTTTDESGSYEIQNIPSGKYSLVFKSSHTKSLNLRDSGGKLRIKQIIVEQGQTVDGSFDFGMTAY